jgi:hypothetical protein
MAMSPFLPARGLRTNESPELSQGALEAATNALCRRIGVLEPRMGIRGTHTPAYSSITRLFPYDTAPYAYAICDLGAGVEHLVRHDPVAGTSTDLGAAEQPAMSSAARQSATSAGGSFIISTAAGQQKLDSPTAAALLPAGMPRGLDGVATLNGAGPGFLPADRQVAYRNMWVRASGNTPPRYVYGAPSGRSVVINPVGGVAGDKVNLTIPIPAGITTADWLHLSRTLESASATEDPGEDYRLCWQGHPTAVDIGNGYMTIVDVRPGTLLREAAYYATSARGPQEANQTPPIAGAMAAFKGCVFAGNVKAKHRLILSMIVDPASAAGVQLADTIVIDGITFTAGAAEALATRTFKRFAGGSASQNIASTVKSLVNVINRGTGSTKSYAYYASGPDDMPGIFWVEERTIGGTGFAATAPARGTAYEPALPAAGTDVSSDNNVRSNGLLCTPQDEPEHWPETNEWFAGGSNTSDLVALVPLREAMIVVTTRGIYRLVGNTPDDFELLLVDPDLKSAAPYSWVEVDNKAIGATERGLVAIGESGLVEDLPRPLGTIITDARTIRYTTHKEFLVFVGGGAYFLAASTGYRYSFRTKEWTGISTARGVYDGVELFKSGYGYLVFGVDAAAGRGFCKEEHGGDTAITTSVKDTFDTTEVATIFARPLQYTRLVAGAPGVPKKVVEVVASTEPVADATASIALGGIGNISMTHLAGSWTRARALIGREFQRGDAYSVILVPGGVVNITGIQLNGEVTGRREVV